MVSSHDVMLATIMSRGERTRRPGRGGRNTVKRKCAIPDRIPCGEWSLETGCKALSYESVVACGLLLPAADRGEHNRRSIARAQST
eukprot:116479-Prymnesium_polylepis.1